MGRLKAPASTHFLRQCILILLGLVTLQVIFQTLSMHSGRFWARGLKSSSPLHIPLIYDSGQHPHTFPPFSPYLLSSLFSFLGLGTCLSFYLQFSISNIKANLGALLKYLWTWRYQLVRGRAKALGEVFSLCFVISSMHSV